MRAPKTRNTRNETRDKSDAKKEKTDELRYRNAITTLTKDSGAMATGDETGYSVMFSWKKIVSEFLSHWILMTILNSNLYDVLISHPNISRLLRFLENPTGSSGIG